MPAAPLLPNPANRLTYPRHTDLNVYGCNLSDAPAIVDCVITHAITNIYRVLEFGHATREPRFVITPQSGGGPDGPPSRFSCIMRGPISDGGHNHGAGAWSTFVLLSGARPCDTVTLNSFKKGLSSIGIIEHTELPAMPNTLNVFSGKNSLVDYYNPDCNPPLPLVELPDHPFVEDGVRIYAKMMTALPAGNVKALPALNMLLRGREQESITADTRKVVEYSSGNTVISLSIIANILGIGSTCAYISNKTSQAKINLLRFFGLELTLFGGPAQVEPADVNGGIFAALKDGGERPDYYCPGQYSNPQNSEAHIRWTGPQLLAQLPDISIFAAAVGTSGTMTGTGAFLKSKRPDLVNLGVFTAPRDRVPGPRPIDLIQSVDLPWREVIDCSEHVDSYSSYKASLDLCRTGLLGGPSSGLAYVGLLQYLQRQKENGGLAKLRNERGSISCAFIVCDLPYQYIGEYVSKLGESAFPPIHNAELLNVDTYPYGVDWKISAKTAQRKISSYCALITPPSSPTPSEASMDEDVKVVVVIDLREVGSRPALNVSNVQHFPVCSKSSPNPFSDPSTLAREWKLMDAQLGTAEHGALGKDLKEKVVILVCYEGHTSSVGASVLRSRGVEAYWVEGGVNVWSKLGKF